MLYNLSTGWNFHAATALPCKKEFAVLIGPYWPEFGDEKNLFPQPEIEFHFLSCPVPSPVNIPA
jgi:hypothetical protein